MHFRVITETAPEVLTPLLIAGGLAAVTIVAFLLFLRYRHKIGPRRGKDQTGPRSDRAPRRKKRKRP